MITTYEKMPSSRRYSYQCIYEPTEKRSLIGGICNSVAEIKSELKKHFGHSDFQLTCATMPNDQKLSHADGDSRQPETRSAN